nr:MAG TPA: hypothetical protein [Caudoviricetes sp.]
MGKLCTFIYGLKCAVYTKNPSCLHDNMRDFFNVETR